MNFFLLVFVPACFALNPVIARAVIDQFGPASLSVIRWLLSAIIIGVGACWLSERQAWCASARTLVGIAILGVLGMGFCAFAAYEAARTTQAANIGLIYGCTTAFVASWEVAEGRQRASGLLFGGIAACLVGVLLTLTKGHPEILRNFSFAAGDLWAAAGMLVFAFYTVALRRMPAMMTPLAQFTLMSAAAAIVFLPIAVLEVATLGLPVFDWRMLAWLLALVLLAGIGAYLGYNVSVRRNGPVLTAASICLTPIYAAIQALFLLGEALAWYHGVALFLVVAGLLAINRA